MGLCETRKLQGHTIDRPSQDSNHTDDHFQSRYIVSVFFLLCENTDK